MVSQHLIGVALQQLISGAVSVARFSGNLGGDSTSDVAVPVLGQAIGFLQARFTDQSARLTKAIEESTDRSWRALELVLAGDSLWDRLKGVLAPGDMKAFRHDLRGLLAAAGIDGGYPVDRRAAARDLRAARKAGHLQPTGLTPAGMVNSIGIFARFDDPAELASAQWRAAEAVAADLKTQGYAALAVVAAFRPGGGSLPLLGVAIRYFFRRAVEQDAELARGLSFARLEALTESQKNQFESLNRVITNQTDQLDAALGELAVEVAEIKVVALDIRAEQERLGDQNRQIMEAVLALQAKLEQVGRAAVRPRDSVSIRTEAEREMVKKVIAQYRSLPEATRVARPALRNAVGMLEVATGDFAAARLDFTAVAQMVPDPISKGAAHMNGYRSALEARDWPSAMQELLSAVRCDGRRYAPFLMGKYTPQRILGAGGFGVAFLCKHKYMDARVVVKTLSGEGADFDAVFVEARAASGIQHPGIVRVTDCGYVDPPTKDRPFVVMDYFLGQALDEYVRETGVIPADRLVPLSRSLAEALGAAHEKGILHRDVKPGNILVRSNGPGFEARVIDFGLAVRHRVTGGDTSHTRSAKTLAGESLAGTLEYAAPEQLGRIAARVGPYSDIYGWAKTCCFALFQTAQPTLRHWQGLTPAFADLLSRCLEEDPSRRPQSFAAIIAELDALGLGAAGKLVIDAEVVPSQEFVESRLRRSSRDRDDDDDYDRSARSRRRDRDDDDRPSQRSRRETGGSFPIWVAAGLGLAAIITVVVIFIASRKKTDPAVNSDTASQGTKQGGTANGLQSGGTGQTGKGNPSTGNGGSVEPNTTTDWSDAALTPPPKPPATAQPPKPWKDTPAEGGAFSNNDYREVRADGSVLIGFELGLGKVFNTDIISYLRPIWRTPAGAEEFGTAYGKRPATVGVVKAKDGYLLAGAVVAGGGALEGICFTFMKRNGEWGVDSTDWYTSNWFGEQTRKPDQKSMRGGDGSLVVGIHGKRFADKGGNSFDDGGAIGSIGFVLAPSGTNPASTGIPGKSSSGTGPASAELPAGWRESRVLGGIFADKEFREFRTDGSLVIGFELGTEQVATREQVSYLRPIWLTPAGGEEFGTAYGKKPATIVSLKAKDGYALSGIVVAGGGTIDGLSLVFAKRVPKKGLSTSSKDSYTSEWVGDQSRKKGGEAVTALAGFPVVGIHGKKFEDKGGTDPNETGAIGAFGLIVPNKVDGWQAAITAAPTGPSSLGVVPAGKVQRTTIVGGGGEAYDDAAPVGGWLIGVDVYIGKFGSADVIAGVRPLFLTGDKASEGERHGKSTDKVVHSVAKPGYAVGAITVKAGGGMDGFSVTFMKVKAGKLDPNDSYESEWFGGEGGGGKTKIGGDGTPVTGLCGRANYEGHTAALGLITTGGK